MSETYQIAEHFCSIQGEGVNAGATAIFLRLQGCPVGCAWCDSKPTWYGGGEEMTLDAISAALGCYPRAAWIVVTGGEPLIWDLDDLFLMLKARFNFAKIQIETSGAFPYKGDRRPDWTCVSPKYPAQFRVAPNVLRSASELKYVVDEHFTPDIVHGHLQQRREDAGVYPILYPPVSLMPEGSPPRPEMVERTLDLLRSYPGWRFGPRLQYDYAAIRANEGENNLIIDPAIAKGASRARRLQREAEEPSYDYPPPE